MLVCWPVQCFSSFSSWLMIYVLVILAVWNRLLPLKLFKNNSFRFFSIVTFRLWPKLCSFTDKWFKIYAILIKSCNFKYSLTLCCMENMIFEMRESQIDLHPQHDLLTRYDADQLCLAVVHSNAGNSSVLWQRAGSSCLARRKRCRGRLVHLYAIMNADHCKSIWLFEVKLKKPK